MFTYDDVTTATQPEYLAHLDRLAGQFREWTERNRAHKDEPLARSYELWWLFKGPTGFASTEDALRFRTELFARIVAASDA